MQNPQLVCHVTPPFPSSMKKKPKVTLSDYQRLCKLACRLPHYFIQDGAMAGQDPNHQLASLVSENLEEQQLWKEVQIHTHSSTGRLLPRPLVSGLPPRRLYLHPDDQIELIKANSTYTDEGAPEVEWVLPTHIDEKWTLKSFAEVFGALDAPQPSRSDRPKRLVLGTLHDDSTVVYYLIHDGIVKPRQN